MRSILPAWFAVPTPSAAPTSAPVACTPASASAPASAPAPAFTYAHAYPSASAYAYALALACLTLAGCGSDDSFAVSVDVTGRWTGTVKNESNSCPGAFNVGDTNVVSLLVTQDTRKVTLKLEAGAGVVASLLLGSDTFAGTIEGAKIDASLIGSTEATQDTCKYSYTATINATAQESTMSGTVTYRPNAKSGDCSAIASCSRVQSFTASRAVADAGAGG